jgi:acyl carrier protein
MKKMTEQEVIDTMRTALGPEGQKLTATSKAGDLQTWDSLGHLGILAALDKKFDGRVADIDELAAADSVQTILSILKEKSLI